MKVKTLKGREVYWKNPGIDWASKSKSNVQRDCKMVLALYWLADSCGEEVQMPASLLRFDFVNFTKKIIVECDSKIHDAYNKHFHKNNIFNFVGSMKRDEMKNKFAEINNFRMIRVYSKGELQQVLINL